tara:strand:+ start:355 stop:624 length:270 start_codon:yes stop_codon:yes gene_type:complete
MTKHFTSSLLDQYMDRVKQAGYFTKFTMVRDRGSDFDFRYGLIEMSEGTYSNHVPGWNYNGEYFRTPVQLRDAINQTIVDALLPPEEES